MTLHLTKFGQGMPLVFFHGWGFDSQIWLSLIPELQSFYQVVLVDLPGFGKSALMDWPEFKANILNSLPEEFALIGWSMGGLYATRLALEAPTRVKYLFNVTSSPRFLSDSIWPGVPHEVLLQFHQKLSENKEATLNEFISLQLKNSSIEAIKAGSASEEGLKAGLGILEQWDLRSQLSEIKTYTCFLFGRLDPITPVATMKRMETLYPEFSYVLFNKAAHMPFLSHPKEFIAAISGFIQ